jgi:steroid delta-isomerase-like uncharacterized protein
MSEANKAMVRSVIEAVNRRDLDAAAARFAPQYVWQGPGRQQAYGPDGWKELVATYIKAFPDLQFTIEDLIAEGDKVAARYTVRGTFRGELAGIEPTERSVSVPCLMISRIENGQIVEDFEAWDQLTMYQDLGALSAVAAAHT